MDKFGKLDLSFFESIANHMDCKIFECGHFHGTKDWKHEQITSSFNRLYFVLEGEGHVKNNHEEIVLKPGVAYIIPLNTTNDYNCDTTIEKFYIHFRMELFYFKDVFEITGSYLRIPFDQNTLVSILEKVKANDWVSSIALKAFILQHIALLSEPITKSYQQNMEIAYKYQEVFNYIKLHCRAQLTAQEISEHFNIPIAHLMRNFRKDLGISLKGYIQSTIIQSAQDQMLLTDLLIKEISFNLGFCDEFYFSRFFKKHTSMSPKVYRKQNKLSN